MVLFSRGMVLFSVRGLVEAVCVECFYFHVEWFYFQYLDSLKQFVLNGFIFTWNGFVFSTLTR